MNDENPYSHLRTLIGREIQERIEETPENLVGRVLNLAEFLMLHNPKELNASDEEIEVATNLIQARGLGYLLLLEKEEFPKYVTAVREHIPVYTSFCIKCGRSLKNKTALKTGMGITCRGAVAKGEWITDRKKDDTTRRRDEIKTNDALLMEDSTRLGLRKLAAHYGISVSSIRIDRQTNRRVVEIEKMLMALLDGEDSIEPNYYPVVPEMIIPAPEEPKKKRGRPKGAEKPEEEPEEHGPFNPDIKCKIYNRKADGSHCKRKCKNSEIVMEENPEQEPEREGTIMKEPLEQEPREEEEDMFGDE